MITHGWARASPAVLAGVGASSFSRGFSAVCWFTGRHLTERLGHPIGLVDASWGGTHIAHWVTANDTQHCTGSGAFGRDTELTRDRDLRDRARTEGGMGAPAWESPGDIFNAMVLPFSYTPVFGVLWYQGESDTAGESSATYTQGQRYACSFRALVGSWRKQWQAASGTPPDLPFGFVLASPDGYVLNGYMDML